MSLSGPKSALVPSNSRPNGNESSELLKHDLGMIMGTNIIDFQAVRAFRAGVPVHLAETTGNNDLWDALGPIAGRVNTGEDEASYEHSLARFSREQRYAHAVLAYASEVEAGGHARFFNGSSGLLWRDAMKGLREIGAHDGAMILSEAALRAGGTPPANRSERQNLLERLSPRFNDLDARYHRANPVARLRRYMENNAASFYFPRAAL